MALPRKKRKMSDEQLRAEYRRKQDEIRRTAGGADPSRLTPADVVDQLTRAERRTEQEVDE